MSNHPIVRTWRARIAASGQQNDPTDHTEFARGWVAAMEHAEVALVGSLQTTQETLPEVRALVDAARAVLDDRASTYRARNGKQVRVEGSDGEKCWIVHSDFITYLENALRGIGEEPK